MKCLKTNRHKTFKSKRAPLQLIYTGEPFLTVTIVIIFHLLQTERGNRYILTVDDHFTKRQNLFVAQPRGCLGF